MANGYLLFVCFLWSLISIVIISLGVLISTVALIVLTRLNVLSVVVCNLSVLGLAALISRSSIILIIRSRVTGIVLVISCVWKNIGIGVTRRWVVCAGIVSRVILNVRSCACASRNLGGWCNVSGHYDTVLLQLNLLFMEGNLSDHEFIKG